MMVKEDEKALKTGKENMNVEPEEKRTKVTGDEVESQKPIVNEERNIDLQLDLEKADRDSATVTASRNKLLQHVQKQQQPNIEKIGKKNSGFLFFFFFFFPFELRTFVLLKFCQFGR
jgi:hypothetical protein